MDSVDTGIFEQLMIISRSAIDTNTVTELASPFAVRTSQRRNFDSTQPAQILGMHFPHETGSDQRSLYHLHKVYGLA
jgi:hypothetical protein